jgi:hypothetical protein
MEHPDEVFLADGQRGYIQDLHTAGAHDIPTDDGGSIARPLKELDDGVKVRATLNAYLVNARGGRELVPDIIIRRGVEPIAQHCSWQARSGTSHSACHGNAGGTRKELNSA